MRRTLNRLVFTGIETCEWSFDDDSIGIRGAGTRPNHVVALATVSMDRIALEWAAAGLTRVRRAPDTDEWRGPGALRVQLVQGGADAGDSTDAVVREYAVLLTRTIPLDDLTIIRTSTPAVQLALWWRSHARARLSAVEDTAVEDIIELVARRTALADDVRSLPAELRDPIADATAAFLATDSCEWVIGRALADSRLSPGLAQRVMTRFRRLTERA